MLSLNRIGVLLLIGVCIALPFELRQPLLRIATVQFTNLELVVYACIGAGLLLHPQWTLFWRWTLGCLFVTLLVACLSSLFALAPQAAIFGAFRFAIGVLLAIAVGTILRENPAYRSWIYMALGVGVLTAASLGVIEVALNQPLVWLTILRDRVTTVGPFLRLTSTFDHANQAAMYIEALVPMGIFASYQVWQRQQRWLAFLIGCVTLGLFQAALLTLSRASFATLIIVLLCLCIAVWIGHKRQLARYLTGCMALMLFVLGLNILLHPVLQLRLQSEGDDAWYQAQFVMPTALTGTAGASMPVAVQVQNRGLLTWSEQLENPIRLGAHWYDLNGDQAELLAVEPRWRFPGAIAPEAMATWEVRLDLPAQPGIYQLDWDVVHENITWFSQKNGNVAATTVTVLATGTVQSSAVVSDATQRRTAPLDETLLPPIPHRRTLWGAALMLWQTRPWLGIGLDNFRLQYGPVLNMTHFNDTIHTNNWYVETLVSLGLLGALPFFFWLALLCKQLWLRLLAIDTPLLQLGVGAGLLTFMVHGLLDYFLLFNGTAFLFWILVGLWSSYETARA